jgi:hypothetical protein
MVLVDSKTQYKSIGISDVKEDIHRAVTHKHVTFDEHFQVQWERKPVKEEMTVVENNVSRCMHHTLESHDSYGVHHGRRHALSE